MSRRCEWMHAFLRPFACPTKHYFVGPSVLAEPPRSIFLPSGNWMSRELARNEPSFAWNATTFTFVPVGSESLFQPLRNNTDGDPPSIFHRTTVPSGCATSMCSQECGFTHSIITTLPSSVTCLFWSNSAENEWCANTGNAAAMRAPALATTVNNFLCIGLTPYLTTLLLHRISDGAFT